MYQLLNSLAFESTKPTMIKVAIAGTNGFAQYIAHFVTTQTYHQFVILSRTVS